METKESLKVLRELIESHPLKQIRGRFRSSLNFDDWTFSEEGENPSEVSKAFSTFLEEEKPYIVFITEDGKFSMVLKITKPSIFDGDPPTEPKDIYFLRPEFEDDYEEKIVIILKTNESWPDWNESGEFVAELPMKK